MDANDAAAPCTSIWRPSRELLADARAASERGDAETACRLGWAAFMHASTRGNSNPKYALSDNAFKAAMEIAVKAGEVHGCDFEAITCAINVEIASDNERPATGPEASAANRLAQQARDDEETSFPVPLARLPDGARVRVKGLTSREDLNGRLGMILSHISNCDRYAVQIEGSGECVRLRSDTVSPIESRPADAPMAGALVEAARAGHLKKLRNLVKLGADVNGTGLGRGGRPLSAAAVGDQLECLRFLLDQGADPNAPNAYGSTALHDASYNGVSKCAEELLRRGAAANAADVNGNTPLIAACAAGHVGIVKALVAHGAKVSEKAFSANRAGTHTNQASLEEALLNTTSELAAHGHDEPSDAWKAAQGSSAALKALLAATTSAALREALLTATPFAEVPAIAQALPRARQRLKELKLAEATVAATAGAAITATAGAAKVPAAAADASPALTTGCICMIDGLTSRPELNGERAVIEAPAAEGRYQVAVPHGGGKALRIRLKREALTPTPMIVGVDPRVLPKWPGLACGSSVRCMLDGQWKDTESLIWSFQKAIPAGVSVSGGPRDGRADHLAMRAQMAEMMKVDPKLASSPMAQQLLQRAMMGTQASNLTPHTQWLWSLVHIVSDYHKDTPKGVFRFLLAHAKSGGEIVRGGGSAECLIIDVLSPALACPPEIEKHTTAWGDSPDGTQKSGQAASEPLLPVRYWHIPNDDADRSKRQASLMQAGPNECAMTRAAVAAKAEQAKERSKRDNGSVPGPICVQAESVEEVHSALAMLRANEALLSPQYRAFFDSASRFNGPVQFRPSFLVPPPHPTPEPLKRWLTCTGCGAKQAIALASFCKCIQCKTHWYCTPECRDRHRPVHKLVCGASVATLRASPTNARPSLLISTVPPESCIGKYCPMFNFQGAASPLGIGAMDTADVDKYLVKEVAPINLHGDRCFLVKVQPPGSGEGGSGPCGFPGRASFTSSAGESSPWACIVYDEPRSLTNVYLPLDTPGIEDLLALIKRSGIRVASGAYKAYCEAKREGPCLRIYIDRLAPQQKW